jgi:hypothetical protein
MGNPAFIALVIEWDNLLFQGLIEILGISLILYVGVVVHPAMANGETILAIVGFVPPAIENREIQTPVQNDLLTAGAASLQWSSRGVQPHVHSLDKVAGDVVIVVLDENDPPPVGGVDAISRDPLQEQLALAVPRVSLAGEDNLDRSSRVYQ